MSMSVFVHPVCLCWNRVSSVSLFLSLDFMCFIVEKCVAAWHRNPESSPGTAFLSALYLRNVFLHLGTLL